MGILIHKSINWLIFSSSSMKEDECDIMVVDKDETSLFISCKIILDRYTFSRFWSANRQLEFSADHVIWKATYTLHLPFPFHDNYLYYSRLNIDPHLKWDLSSYILRETRFTKFEPLPMTCSKNITSRVVDLAILLSRFQFFSFLSLRIPKCGSDTWSSLVYQAWLIIVISSRNLEATKNGCLMIFTWIIWSAITFLTSLRHWKKFCNKSLSVKPWWAYCSITLLQCGQVSCAVSPFTYLKSECYASI